VAMLSRRMYGANENIICWNGCNEGCFPLVLCSLAVVKNGLCHCKLGMSTITALALK
jgi:hypothetical protein